MDVVEKMVPLDEIIGYISREGYQYCEFHMSSQCYMCPDMRSADIVAETFASKRADNQYADLLESMRNNGFRGAVCISQNEERPQLMNGHHRIAAAAELGIVDIPVTYSWRVADDATLWPEDSERNPEYWARKRKADRAEREARGEYAPADVHEAQQYYKDTGIVPDGFRKCGCCTVMYYN